MPLVSTHVVLEVGTTDGYDGISISCSDAKVLEELCALDTSTDGMKGVFDFTFSDVQMTAVIAAEKMMSPNVAKRYKRNADGGFVFTEADLKIWKRNDAGTCLFASVEAWKYAQGLGLRVEHVMDALGMAHFDLVSSIAHGERLSQYQSNVVKEYIFRRRVAATRRAR